MLSATWVRRSITRNLHDNSHKFTNQVALCCITTTTQLARYRGPANVQRRDVVSISIHESCFLRSMKFNAPKIPLAPNVCRSYSTKTNGNETLDPEQTPWIDILETTARAPWLKSLAKEDADRLKFAYGLIFQVIVYLGRPQANTDPDAGAAEYLSIFATAPVPPDSDIGRARRAIALLTAAVVHHISSVPAKSPLRAQHPELFNVFDALVPLSDVYLAGTTSGDVSDWKDFWGRAQPILVALAEQLDKEGYVLKPDLGDNSPSS